MKTREQFEPRALTVKTFCRLYGIGRTKTYELIKSGQLKTIRLGGRRLVPVDAAERLIGGGK